MFEDSLVESTGRIRTRAWTKLVSFAIQAVLIIFVILLPLIYTEALPSRLLNTMVVAPPPPPPPPPPPAPTVKVTPHVSEVVNGELRTPSKIPKKINMVEEHEAPPPASGVIGGVVGGVPGGSTGGVLGGLIQSTAPPPKVATPQKVRISQGVLEGSKTHDVTPQYPQMARLAHVQGDVVLRATISKTGSIENLQVMSGPPMLIQSAMDAVRQWKYKPYALNGEPVEVETVITVKFHM